MYDDDAAASRMDHTKGAAVSVHAQHLEQLNEQGAVAQSNVEAMQRQEASLVSEIRKFETGFELREDEARRLKQEREAEIPRVKYGTARPHHHACCVHAQCPFILHCTYLSLWRRSHATAAATVAAVSMGVNAQFLFSPPSSFPRSCLHPCPLAGMSSACTQTSLVFAGIQ